MSDQIHVALASDDGGVDGLAVAAASALRFSMRPVALWIIEDGIDAATQARLLALFARISTASSVTFLSQRGLPLKLPSWWVRSRWPLSAAARFQLPELLPPQARRCIYLDIDTLVGTDLGELFDTDLRGHPVGMVLNTGMSPHDRDYVASLGVDPDRYCNSGVLLMDLTAWRAEGAGAALIDLGRAMRPDLWFFDQDMLNVYFKDRCLLLDEKWNCRNAGAAPEDRVLHFAGSPKPWQTQAGDATAPGLVAWHRARAESGFVGTPRSAYLRWRKAVGVRLAQARRRVMTLTR
ncbi:MAG: glycosyltransferase family 8 protein [Burkholderiaceae bacterium]